MFYRNKVLKNFDALEVLNCVDLQKEPLCGLFLYLVGIFLFSNFRLYNIDANFFLRFCAELL